MALSDTQSALASEAIDALRLILVSTTSERNVQAFARVDALRKLPPAWDGYQGVAPSEQAIDQAKAFIADLPADLRMPKVEPSGDGEINLVWRGGEFYLEVGFTGAPAFSFLGKIVGRPETRQFGDVPFSANRLPISLHSWMRRIADADLRVREPTAEPTPLAWAS